jgi:DNA-directed RNA polymerase specialized sigma24 family protein
MGYTPKLKNTDFLNEVAKHHKEWVRTVTALGGGSYSEDIVQEMYIKLYKYADANKIIKNGILQKGYVFFALKSIIYTLAKEKSLILKENIENHHIPDTTNHEEEQAFQKFSNKIDDYLHSLEKKSKTENNERYWYDGKMFQMYKDNDLSMRKLAKLSGISWVSIFHTLKNVKQDLRNNFQEDWEDYLNGDYDKIR